LHLIDAPAAGQQPLNSRSNHWPCAQRIQGNNLSTTTIAVIVVTAVGLLLLAAVLVWLAQRTRKHQRHNKAHNIRGEAAEETLRIRQRDALADETAPRPAPPKPKPTSKRPKPPVCNSRPPPAAARHHLPRPPQRAV